MLISISTKAFNLLKYRTLSVKLFYSQNVQITKNFCTGVEKFDEIPKENIRNFSIIAHVDHGKSTLADRMLEITDTLKVSASGQAQILDSLQVERERGITVKAQSASLIYRLNGKVFLLNLIDTPGHVDFSNEVKMFFSILNFVPLIKL